MPPTPPIARRTALLGGLGAVSAAALAACSGSESADGSRTGSSGRSAGAASVHPVSLSGKEGTATVNSAPKRVLAYGFLRDTDLALALGAPLVGVSLSNAFTDGRFTSGFAPWQTGVPAGVTKYTVAPAGAPFEKIAQLRPDLILASDDYSLPMEYAKLSRIAPTMSSQRGVGADTWQTMITRTATLFDRSDLAQQLITKTTAQVARTRKKYPGLEGRTFTFGPVGDLSSVFTINSTTDAGAVFFQELGMKLSPSVTSLPNGGTPGRAQLSLEQLDHLDADVLMLSYPSTAVQKAFEALPAFHRLPAVQRGSYVVVDYATAIAVAFPSVLSIPYGLDRVAPQLAAAAAKR